MFRYRSVLKIKVPIGIKGTVESTNDTIITQCTIPCHMFILVDKTKLISKL